MRSLAVSSSSYTYTTVYDEFNDEWLIFGHQDFTLKTFNGAVKKIQINLNTNSPNFNWHTRITNILVDDSLTDYRFLAYSTSGTGFAFRSSNNEAVCLELIHTKSTNIASDWEFVRVSN